MDDGTLDRFRHDLRSPLVVITGFADILASDRPVTDAERRQYAERIRDAAEELSELLDCALGD